VWALPRRRREGRATPSPRSRILRRKIVGEKGPSGELADVKTWVLVHGAWHGAWCWERLRPHLEKRGDRVITMDLPVSDATATFEDYAACVIDAAEGAENPVVVGHSLGAMVIPLVARRRAVERLVFLCGVVPHFGGVPWEAGPKMALDEASRFVPDPQGGLVWPSVEDAAFGMYHDCTAEDASWAFQHLRRQDSTSLWDRPYPLTSWTDVPRSAIAAHDDRIVRIEWSRYAATELLRVPLVELAGSHSPFLSRPAELADALRRTTRPC
jgi:pimeloyl-ACP methyl ester carboxylesterase